MKATKNDTNRVILRGKVNGKYISDKVSRLYLKVKDYQQKADEYQHIKRNTVTVSFYGASGRKAVESYERGDRVSITGVIQSVHNPMTNTWSQECWGLTIEKTKTILEDMSEGEFFGDIYPEDENLVFIRGKVTTAYAQNKNWLTLTVRTLLMGSNGKKQYLSNSSLTWHTSDAVAHSIELTREGTEVAIVGKLESIEKKGKDGKNHLFENVIVRELKILSNQPSKRFDVLEHKIKEAIMKDDEKDDELPVPEGDFDINAENGGQVAE